MVCGPVSLKYLLHDPLRKMGQKIGIYSAASLWLLELLQLCSTACSPQVTGID